MNAPADPNLIATLRMTWHAIQVRLRFIAVLLLAFVVVGSWESIRNRVETGARRFIGSSLNGPDQVVTADTEYFCPMDPGILSDWPGRCGACNMALVHRKKGEASPRPDGVIARMQFSPYRVQQAGIQTASVDYKPLELEITGVGSVTRSEGHALVQAHFFDGEFAMVAVGQSALIQGEISPPARGRVTALQQSASCLIELNDPKFLAHLGSSLVVKIQIPASDLEAIRSLPTNAPPVRPGELRTVYFCADHPDILKELSGRCPIDRNLLDARKLTDNQRIGWWCPMHPLITFLSSDKICNECNNMPLIMRIVNYRPSGRVLAVPETALVDTGTRKIVFVEKMPGMFDAVEIRVGPRCGGEYPVLSGLESGDRVATAGALLIDAETRLNPNLATAYFGATSRLQSTQTEPARVVEKCPITGKPLGSMGPPVRVEIEGRNVWICCSACESLLRKNPTKYLAKPAVSP